MRDDGRRLPHQDHQRCSNGTTLIQRSRARASSNVVPSSMITAAFCSSLFLVASLYFAIPVYDSNLKSPAKSACSGVAARGLLALLHFIAENREKSPFVQFKYVQSLFRRRARKIALIVKISGRMPITKRKWRSRGLTSRRR